MTKIITKRNINFYIDKKVSAIRKQEVTSTRPKTRELRRLPEMIRGCVSRPRLFSGRRPGRPTPTQLCASVLGKSRLSPSGGGLLRPASDRRPVFYGDVFFLPDDLDKRGPWSPAAAAARARLTSTATLDVTMRRRGKEKDETFQNDSGFDEFRA